MLVWQGAGILAALIPVFISVACHWAADSYFGGDYSSVHLWPNTVA